MRVANKVTSIEKRGSGFSIMTDAVEIRLMFMTDDILRIRAGFDGDFAEESYTLAMTAWEDRMDDVLMGYRRRIEPKEGRLLTADEKIARLAGLDHALGYPHADVEGVELICGAKMTLVVFREPYMLKIFNEDGQLVHEDIPYMGLQEDSNHRRIHYSALTDQDHYYGFGERTGKIDKREEYMQLIPGDSMGYNAEKTDRLYKHIPFYVRLNDRTRQAVGYFYHNTFESDFDMGRSHTNYVRHHSIYRTDGGDIDLFFINGPKISDVIERYTDLTGKSVMLPVGALGYLGSSMYYPELPKDADDAVIDFIDTTREENIPIDGFQLSSGYCNVETSQGLKRCTFTWNHDRFKDPAGFFAEMTRRGVSVSPNIKPGMLLCHPLHDEFVARGMFVRDSKEDKPAVGIWWGGLGNYVDFTDPRARTEWKNYVRKSLVDYGDYSIWNDNCEYDGLTDKDARVSFEGKGATIGQTKAVMANMMCQLAQEAIHEVKPDQRAFVVTRSGHAGLQRYAQTWAGDNFTSWTSLKYNIATILGMGLSGVSNMGCDIGGFYGPAPEEELFVRWVQNGIFQPRFSIHSTNTDNTVTEPWMYSGSKDLISAAIHFRYQLSPYLYSLMRRANETGLPMMQPLFMVYQDDVNTYGEGINFMEGDSLLVANVVDKGATSKEVYFPAGHTFYDFYTREAYAGGETYCFPVDIKSVPLFLADGAILPMASNTLTNLTTEKVTGLRLLLVPSGRSSFVLYEDDGNTMQYQQGGYRRTVIEMEEGERTSVKFASTGTYRSPIEDIYVDMVHREKAPFWVTVAGEQIPHFLHRARFEEADCGWYYSQSRRSVQIKYPNPGRDYELLVSFEDIDLLGM